MNRPLSPPLLRSVYDRIARRYDILHTLLTFRADHRGRTWIVRQAVCEGDRILDAGTGTGATAILASQIVGPNGEIVLFDLSPGMLQVARERIARLESPVRFHFESGDLNHLPFPDDSFDAVLSTYSLCPLEDPAKGVLEMLRVTRPGGRIGFAHSTEPRNRFLRWLGQGVENMVSHFPTISMGCRPVSVLPVLKGKGCSILHYRTLGFPLWPFLACVVQKPTQ